MILKEAKEKEKRQIIDAYDEGIFEGGDYGYYDSNLKKGSADLYYNETYGDKWKQDYTLENLSKHLETYPLKGWGPHTTPKNYLSTKPTKDYGNS